MFLEVESPLNNFSLDYDNSGVFYCFSRRFSPGNN